MDEELSAEQLEALDEFKEIVAQLSKADQEKASLALMKAIAATLKVALYREKEHSEE